MVVYAGGGHGFDPSAGVRLFHVKGTTPYNTRAVEGACRLCWPRWRGYAGFQRSEGGTGCASVARSAVRTVSAVPVSARSLNSGDCFVLSCAGEYCRVWLGSGSTPEEQAAAATVAAFVNPAVRSLRASTPVRPNRCCPVECTLHRGVCSGWYPRAGTHDLPGGLRGP